MKIIRNAIFLIAILSFPCDSYAINSRVLVIPFENDVAGLEGTGKDLTDCVVEEVKKSGACTYISEEELNKNWFIPAREEIEKVFEIDAGEEKIGLEQLRPMFAHENLGTIFEWKNRLGIDLVITGEIRKREGSLNVYSEIIGMDTGRFYSVSSDCELKEIKDTVRKQVKLLLDKSGAVQRVEADSEVDHLWSIVAYSIRTTGGEVIQMRIDFTSERPDPVLQKADFIPSARLENGLKVYELQTKENKPIEFTCSYKGGELEYIRIYTGPPSHLESGKYNEVLSVVSQAGYTINFTFKWIGRSLDEVSVEPLINPYCEVK